MKGEKNRIFLYKYPILKIPYKFFYLCRNRQFEELFMLLKKRIIYQMRLIENRRKRVSKTKNKSSYLKVTIIVPNYNHESFLRERLESIYAQTYNNYEVILLDDASNDKSVEILEEYRERYCEKTSLIVNNKNSGGVFQQWKRGIELATGDLCWIAESDDFADANFLEELVPLFQDEAVMLAYAHMIFWKDGKKSKFTYENYLMDIPHYMWNKEYIRSAYHEVKNALAYKNVIPNASGVVFRRPVDMKLLEDEQFLNMKICGDWIFYLNIIAGGKIAYTPSTNNYCRLHDDSASKMTHTQNCYYEEHGCVAREIMRLYPNCEQEVVKNYDIVKNYYFNIVGKPDEEKFKNLYKIDEILKEKRKLNILISIESFLLGGGEIFPIRLANQIKKRGFPVTVHCYNKNISELKVREMLRSDIPVVYGQTEEELIDLCEKLQIDIINTHHPDIQQVIGMIKADNHDKLKKCIHIATMHGMYESVSEQYLSDCLPSIDSAVDYWIYVAEKNLIPFKKMGFYDKNRYVLIPNGVEILKNGEITRSSLNIGEDAFVVCVASRALAEKGWLESIECISKVRNITKKNIQLLLIGEGDVYNLLKKKGYPQFVHLCGFVNNVSQYYAISDIGMLLSSFSGESMPLTLMECIATGKPVIATDIGEIRWIMTDIDGQMAGKMVNLIGGILPLEEVIDILIEWVEDNNSYLKYKKVAERRGNIFNICDTTNEYINLFEEVWKKKTRGVV